MSTNTYNLNREVRAFPTEEVHLRTFQDIEMRRIRTFSPDCINIKFYFSNKAPNNTVGVFECPICLMVIYKKEDLAMFEDCSHMLCVCCLNKMIMNTSNGCHMCRSNISKVVIYNL